MNAKATNKIDGTGDAWDERLLGADEEFVAPASMDDEDAINVALELQPISIRLQKSLIEDFKIIAELRGLGYQPLMRQILTRFVDCEKKILLRKYASERSKALETQENPKRGKRVA